jgi:hypothetical protein
MLALVFPAVLFAQECLSGNCYDGKGTKVFPSGAKYIGEFRKGQLHGEGTLVFSDGRQYIGSWRDNYRQGQGRLRFPNGDEYVGGFLQSDFHGQGTMTYANGDVYAGQWKTGFPHGKGELTYANGDRYAGEFVNGQCQGYGRMHYSDGSRYEGEWAYNQRHGKGKLIFPGGDAITGEWADDEYLANWGKNAFSGDTSFLRNCNLQDCGNGQGLYTYQDGAKYIGTFRSSRPEGQGTVFYPNGDRYVGSWKNDLPHGRGEMHYHTGRVLGAIWDFGRPVRPLYEQRTGRLAAASRSLTDPEVRIWAVIVGAARYAHMPSLRYTDDDAYQIYAFLKSPEGGAIPDRQIRLYIDEQATRKNILNGMQTIFLQADENDVVIFYFSGHGLEGAFLPIDFDGYNNRIFHAEIKDMLAKSKAKHKLVLADACHSGSILAMKNGVAVLLEKYYNAFRRATNSTALLLSSRGEEYSMEDGGLRSGVFSHFLIKGLKGEADTDRNQIVTITELFNYVHNHVRRYTGNVQTPTLVGQYDLAMPVAVVR